LFVFVVKPVAMSWCTIESDPGVFSEIISSLGVKGVAVEEIYSLDETEQTSLESQSFGLIFLFKWRQEHDPRTCLDPSDVEDLFFARQTVNNACATQAILSVLLNTRSEDVDIGDELNEFKSFAIALDSESRGYAIGGSDRIRLVHNSFARQDPFVTEESRSDTGGKEDVYHFIAYLPFRGKVYE
jgi:ubiquitin carboxyl-terminal hydrolase L5